MRVESLNPGRGCSAEVGEIRLLCPKAFLAMSENVSSSEWDAVSLWTKSPKLACFCRVKEG